MLIGLDPIGEIREPRISQDLGPGENPPRKERTQSKMALTVMCYSRARKTVGFSLSFCKSLCALFGCGGQVGNRTREDPDLSFVTALKTGQNRALNALMDRHRKGVFNFVFTTGFRRSSFSRVFPVF